MKSNPVKGGVLLHFVPNWQNNESEEVSFLLSHSVAPQQSSRTWRRVTGGFTNHRTMHLGADGPPDLRTDVPKDVSSRLP
jgi:hypothetical protein